ncbi:MAG: endonuclease [Firmicutes bacterium HGW-Firmicutes-14]|nr:MAG: endonuclease [Firmicutes bacterium HGW-Firmicutes-14]
MKVMTYNVHSCKDARKKDRIDQISALIRKERPVIVGLNEVETFSPRTRFVNQPRRIAAARDMVYRFGPTLRLGPIGFFGNAILSRFPVCKEKNLRLPGGFEPRCCLRAVLRVPGGYITVFSTHLGLKRRQRTEQIEELRRLVEKETNPVILMGDFNCGPDQLNPLYDFLTDAGSLFGSQLTFPSDRPVDRIDYIMVSHGIQCQGLSIPAIDASDHLPVIAELEMPERYDQTAR